MTTSSSSSSLIRLNCKNCGHSEIYHIYNNCSVKLDKPYPGLMAKIAVNTCKCPLFIPDI